MFGKSDNEKRTYIIYHLRLCDVNKPSEKIIERLNLISIVIQSHLLDEYIDQISDKYIKLVNDFSQFNDISIDAAFTAEGKNLNKMYKDYLSFEEKEAELDNFLDNDLTTALRCKFGFNPLEDNELLSLAIRFENPKSSFIKGIKQSPAQ
jgi:hypothetical protein